jgi:3-oxoadipate enol-lactonase
MPILKLDGADIHYTRSGSGNPLVLVPGFASGLWSWEFQIEELARHFCVIAFDPRGVGESKMRAGEANSIARIAADITLLLDELDIAAANIMGASFGGFVAQEFALSTPGRTKKIVLACTSFGGSQHVAPAADVLSGFASVSGLNSSERIRQYLPMAFSPAFAAAEPGTIDKLCRLREQNSVPEEVYLGQLTSAVAFDASDRIGALECEALVITGDADTVVPKQNSINLAATIPKARLEIIKGGSHMFFVEQAELFNSIVIDFLEGE